MPVSFVAAATEGSGVTGTYPTGILAGDLILLAHNNGNALTAGFTRIAADVPQPNAGHSLDYKLAAGTEGGTTYSRGNPSGSTMLVYRGVDPVAPFVAQGSQAVATLTDGGRRNSGILAATRSGVYVWLLQWLAASGSATLPAGMTLRSQNTGVTQLAWDLPVAAAGEVGNRETTTATGVSSVEGWDQAVVLYSSDVLSTNYVPAVML